MTGQLIWNGRCRACGAEVNVVKVDDHCIVDHIGEHCRAFKLFDPAEYLRFMRCGFVERAAVCSCDGWR